MEEIIKQAKEFALSEIEKYGSPLQINWELSNNKGLALAKALNADKKVVLLGCILMDIKLGEAAKIGQRERHAQISAEAGKTFLNKFDLNQNFKDKVINCIEAHHAKVPFSCLEAEISANADCYRFIHPKGFFAYLNSQGQSGRSFEECLAQSESKMEEKNKILSLDLSKKELEPYYREIKALILASRAV